MLSPGPSVRLREGAWSGAVPLTTAQRRVAREQHEHPPVRGPRHLLGPLRPAGILAPLVKELVGRERPRKDLGSTSFGNGQSFPSGEVTQAFAIASVVSAHSQRKWVKGLAWTLAGATAWQRMEMDAHWASDVAAGALLGAGVGRWVVRRNRGDWWIEPRLEQSGAGVTLRRQW